MMQVFRGAVETNLQPKVFLVTAVSNPKRACGHSCGKTEKARGSPQKRYCSAMFVSFWSISGNSRHGSRARRFFQF
jgi:hypothetical protein